MLNVLAKAIIHTARRLPGMHVAFCGDFRGFVTDKVGLEIGGPSGTFADGGILPVYRYVKGLDNVVFTSTTVWEGTRGEGRTFTFRKDGPTGMNYIAEAADLRCITDGTYEFLLAAHCLEHVANPLKALQEWKRILKPGSRLAVIVPNFRKTFDHRRQPTAVSHMLDDFQRGVGEDDATHIAEILRFHDLSRDKSAGTFEQFKVRALKNFEYRCLHHHVFDERNSRELLELAGLTVLAVGTAMPHHIALEAVVET